MMDSAKEVELFKKLTSLAIISILTDTFQRKKQGKKAIALLSRELSRSWRLPWEAKDKIHSKVRKVTCWKKLPWNNDLVAGAQ